MAKINIEFDTKSKELSLTLDGKAVENVQSVSLSKMMDYYSDSSSDKNEFSFSVLTQDKNEADGYKTYTHILAKQSEEGRKAIADGSATAHTEYPEEFLLIKNVNPVVKRISNFLKSMRSGR